MRILPFLSNSIIVSVLTIAGASSAFGQDASVLYATDGRACTESTLYQLDPVDGSIVSTVGATGTSGMTSLAYHPITGVMYGITTGGEGCDNSLYTVDLATGAATLVGSTGVPGGKPDATFRSDGTLFTYATGDGGLYTVDLGTGEGSLVGNTGVDPWDISLTFDAGVLVMTDGSEIYNVNTDTGLATTVTTLGIDVNDSNMSTTHPQTGQVYLGDTDNSEFFDLYTLNASTGEMVLLGSNTVFQMSAIEFAAPVQSKPVPVLTNWSLVLLAGLLGLFAFMVIRRKA